MSTNPYASHLEDNDPLQVLAATPARLIADARRLTPEQTEAPLAEGKWSPRQIVSHMADCEIAFAFRLRQALAGVDIQPFDQDAWAKMYPHYKMADALHCFGCLRQWNMAFAHRLSEADKQKTVRHPERGEMTVWTILETMAGHDLNHLKQLEKVG